MTGPFADWPHLRGGPSEEQVEEIRDRYRRESSRPTLADMHAELRHVFDRTWRLELAEVRDGNRVTGFSEDLDSVRLDGEREAASARLVLAGQPGPWTWTQVDGGWDGQRG